MSAVLQQHYDEMISSSVDWAGATPSHWEIQRLGRLFRESSQRASSKVELEYPILSVSIHDGISDKEMNEEELDRKVTRSDDRSLYKVVEENDLAYNMMRAWQGGFGAAQVNGLISPAYVVCKPRTSLPSRYFELLLRTPTAVTELKRFSRGITDFRLRLYWDDFKKIEVAVPPKCEQNQILSFLDYETAKIDALIEKQQQLIALLGEKRQAVISHAVTKGLNPDAPMRDSGIEWLGEVPEHWDVCSIGRKMRLCRGVDITKDEQREGNIPVVSSGGIASFHDTATCKGPGVVVGRKGTAGKVHFVEEDFWAHDTTLFVEKFYGNDEKYVYYKLLSMDLARFDTGSANPTLNRNVVHPEKVSWPPLEEQQAIAKHLDDFCELCSEIISKAEDVNETLQERRTALISAAVTGKIDVRGWKPPSTARMPETEMEVA